MRLTKRRSEFNLEMSSEDINMLTLLLKSHLMTVKILKSEVDMPETEGYLQEFIEELTKYQREAYAYDRYLEEQEMGRNRTM